MMTEEHPERVSCSIARKFNLGNYESLEVFVARATEIREDETAKKAYMRCWQDILEQYEGAVKAIKEHEVKRHKDYNTLMWDMTKRDDAGTKNSLPGT